MKIGIDFDNTISNYDHCFNYIAKKFLNIKKNNNSNITKTEIKSEILRKKNGQKLWMKIQGLAYGKYINKAYLNEDFLRFLLISKSRNIKIYIISHKTEYGHFDDKKIPLRLSALKWLKNKNILNNVTGLKKDNIFFANTRVEKINIINEFKCDYFIDDLKEVLNHNKFPKETKKIFYSKKREKNLISFSNWAEIINFFYDDIKQKDLFYLTYFFHKNNLRKISLIEDSGNSKNYKLELMNKKKFLVKIYPSLIFDKRERLKNEFKALKFLSLQKKIKTPKVIEINNELNIGIFQYVDGKKIKKPSNNDLNDIIIFIKNLKLLSEKNRSSRKFNLASEVSTNLSDLKLEITNRKLLIDKNLKQNKSNKLIFELNNIWKVMQVTKNNLMKKSSRVNFILSPSDIGFHNTIKKNESLIFLDFEYFGWDDPIKIVSDFIIHPKNNLNYSQIVKWIKNIKRNFNEIRDFDKRLNLFFPYYLFRWILIIIRKEIIENNKLNNNYKNYNYKSNKLINLNKNILINKYVKILKKINLKGYIDFGEFNFVKDIKK